MNKSLLRYPQGDRNVYYPTGEKHKKCIVIKRVSSGSIWEKRITKRIYDDCLDGECAIDIGANIGVHTVSMLDGVSKYGYVIAFEPQKEIANCLKNTLKDVNRSLKSSKLTNNFTVSGNLVSNKNSKSKFMSNGTGRSRIPIKGKRYNKVWKENEIKTVTLDHFIKTDIGYNKKKLPICLIKIDVEGHEFEVLEGAKNTINNNRPIIYIEVWKDQGDIERLKKWCENNNYFMEPISPNDYRLLPYQ